MKIVAFNRLILERKFLLKTALILIGCAVIGIENHYLGIANKKLREVRSEQKIVKQIAEWEKVLASRGKSIKVSRMNSAEITQYHLTGIGSSNNQYYALINDNVYQVGNVIGEYTVAQIDSRSVTLKDGMKNSLVSLYLYTDSRPQ